jgi:hypothetical protein
LFEPVTETPLELARALAVIRWQTP